MSGEQRALSFVKFPRKACRKKTQQHASERGPRRARAHPHMHTKTTQQEAQNKEKTEGTGKHSRGTMVRRSRGGVGGGACVKKKHTVLPSPSRNIGQTQPATFSSFTVRRDDLPDRHHNGGVGVAALLGRRRCCCRCCCFCRCFRPVRATHDPDDLVEGVVAACFVVDIGGRCRHRRLPPLRRQELRELGGWVLTSRTRSNEPSVER